MAAIKSGLKDRGFMINPTQTPPTPVLFKGGVGEAANMAMDLRENNNIFCSVVIYPVVPKEQARIRVQLSAAHEFEHIDKAVAAFTKVGKSLGVIA